MAERGFCSGDVVFVGSGSCCLWRSLAERKRRDIFYGFLSTSKMMKGGLNEFFRKLLCNF